MVMGFDDVSGVHVLTNGNVFPWSYPSGGSQQCFTECKTTAGCSSVAPFNQVSALALYLWRPLPSVTFAWQMAQLPLPILQLSAMVR